MKNFCLSHIWYIKRPLFGPKITPKKFLIMNTPTKKPCVLHYPKVFGGCSLCRTKLLFPGYPPLAGTSEVSSNVVNLVEKKDTFIGKCLSACGKSAVSEELGTYLDPIIVNSPAPKTQETMCGKKILEWTEPSIRMFL